MSRSEELIGRLVCVAPDEVLSYWQPRPANGFIDVVLTPDRTGHHGFVLGFQTVEVGGLIAPHHHADISEILVCQSGRGRIITDEREFIFEAETVCFIGHDVRHSVVNDSDCPLRLLWIQLPPGHERLFPLIGRTRKPGDPPPDPFDRPSEATSWATELGLTFGSTERPIS